MVANGAEAIEALQRTGYDVVLMDCEMPVMDGFESTRRIRTSIPALPIMAVTADAMLGDRDRCLNKGMNDYLSKPVDLRQVADVLSKWLPSPAAGTVAQTTEPDGVQTDLIFNREALLRRLLGDRQLADTVIQGLLQDVPSQFNHLRARLAAHDAAGFRRLAHALKGAAATVAADRLRRKALEMEQAGAAGELDRCGTLLTCVAKELEEFKSALGLAGWTDPMTTLSKG
jgi:CheY-like chemotaxis protein